MKVLIVEDDADTLLLMREIVEGAGHEVVGATGSVEEAIEAASMRCPDVALFDIRLRGPLLGIEGAQLLRQQCADVAIIFVTGLSDEVVVGATASLHAAAYLVKPVTPEQVLVALMAVEQAPSSKRGNK